MKKHWLKKVGAWTMVNIALLFVLVIVFGREYIGNMQIQRTIAAMQEEKEELDAQQSSTLRFIDYLSSETYLEEEGRRQGLGKEGETLLVVDVPEDAGEDEAAEKASNLLHWYRYFFSSNGER
jgi:cell division protein FtsB